MAISMVSNTASLMAQRNLGKTTNALTNNLARLSSGLRINFASDDAAGLGISEKIRAEVRGLNMASKNSNDGISMSQVAEGALGEVHGILTRMRELAVQSANGSLGDIERGFLHDEFDALRNEIDRISNVTEFNGLRLLDGGLSNGVELQVGIHATVNDRITVTIATTSAANIGGDGAGQPNIASVSLSVVTSAQESLQSIDNAIGFISSRRAGLGAIQNRLNITITNLSVAAEGLTAADSRIREVDVAEETAVLTRNQILQQAGVAVLAQSNQLTSAALSLLGGGGG